MSTEDQTLDLLAYHAFPRLAAAMRSRCDAIIRLWESAVLRTLPAADDLTLKRLRNSLPMILQEICDALASDKPSVTRELVHGSVVHGEARFQDHYNVRELVIEYRLLRRIVIEQVSEELAEPLDQRQNVALNMALDTAVQSGLIVFTDQQRHQIQAAAEVQSKYLAFLSHDLRNHLNHATLVLELLGQRLSEVPECAESVEDVRSIQRCIFDTTAGMDRLLQAERLRKQSAQRLKAEPVELHPLLSHIVEQCFHAARAKGLQVEVDVPDKAIAQTDRELVLLVLQNLLGNAVKYSSGGRIALRARTAASTQAEGWAIEVSDQGPGIAPKNLGKLFDAFARGDTHGQSGMGLGLSIASQATHLLGGKLEIESTLGVGSTFRLLLPNLKANPEN